MDRRHHTSWLIFVSACVIALCWFVGASCLRGQAQAAKQAVSHSATAKTKRIERLDIALFNAAQRGNIEQVRKLLAQGANPAAKNKDGERAFDIAAYWHYFNISGLLAPVTPGAPLIIAVEHGSAAQVAAALAKDSSTIDVRVPDRENKTPLMLAATDDGVFSYLYTPVKKSVKQTKGSVSTLYNFGASPEAPAVCRKLRHEDQIIVQMLMTKGASITCQDTLGSTPLDDAVTTDNLAEVQTLLAHGADPNHKDVNGRTILMDATFDPMDPETLFRSFYGKLEPFDRENHEIVSLLLSRGATIDAQDNDGATALMLAVECGDQYVAPVQWLLAAGADPNLKDHKGKTALDYARYYKDLKAIPLLKQAMQADSGKSRTASKGE